MKKVLWPIIHKFKIHNNLCLIKYPWGWMPYNNINELKYNIPKTEYNLLFPLDWEERQQYYSTHLNIKVKDIYSSIFHSYFNNDNWDEYMQSRGGNNSNNNGNNESNSGNSNLEFSSIFPVPIATQERGSSAFCTFKFVCF